MKANQLRDLSSDELLIRQHDGEKNLINFRLQLATGVVENVRLTRQTRREIARIKTILRERELAAAKGTQS